jgi:hypothetical protein
VRLQGGHQDLLSFEIHDCLEPKIVSTNVEDDLIANQIRASERGFEFR